MLSRRYEASALAYLLPKSMQSAIHSLYLQNSTMRSMSAMSLCTRMVLTTKPSPVPSANNSRLWQPQNGIVFDTSNSARNISSIQATSETRTPLDEADLLSLQHIAEDICPVENSTDTGAKTPKPNGDICTKITPTATQEIRTNVNVVESSEVESEDTPRSFVLSPKLFEAAKNAKPGSPESYWSHSLYRRPTKKPGKSKEEEDRVTVYYCKSKETSERVAKYFIEDNVIGFDIEWSVPLKPGPKNNVSLIQLANEERIALFHIAMYPKNGIDDLVAPTLKKIMENPNITKVGVAIRGDCTRLRKHLNIESKGLFELSHLYKLVRYSASGETSLINKRLVSLQTQVEEYLQLPMFKGEEVRSSDWSQPLKMDQIMYAASDSYAGLRLYDALEKQRKQLIPTPPRPYHAELELPIRLADGIMIETTEEQIEEPELNQVQDSTSSTTPKTTTTPTKKPKSKDPKQPKEKAPPSPESQAAELWVKLWKSSLPKVHIVRAPDRHLQAYSLWHVQGFDLVEVCGLLRKPPLASTTVQSYILDAVMMECLEFDRGRMIGLVKGMGEGAMARYRRVVGQLGL